MTVRSDAKLKLALQQLQQQDPQGYSFLFRHHETVIRAIEASDRSYSTSAQLYEILEDPQISRYTFSRTLSCMSQMKVVEPYTPQRNTNLYDLRAYDPAQYRWIREALSIDSSASAASRGEKVCD